MAATPSGTKISTSATAKYYSTNGTLMPTATSNTVTVTVDAPATTGAYIKSWLVNGYYSNSNNSTRLSTDYLGGEAEVTPGEGSTSGGKTWTKLASTGDVIDLAAYYNNPSYCAGYAHVYINSATAQTGQLWLGSDNGIKVWLNGSNVWTNDSTRGWTADQDKVNVSLVQGWNKLLVKISQYGGIWCFSAKLCDSSGNALPGITYALNPPATSAPTGDYIKSWLLNGYYSNTNNSTRLSTDYLGGEGNVAPGEGSASGGKTWTKVDSSVGRIDLAAYYNNPSYCAGYAHVYINSATAQTGQLWLGSDNGIKVWLNGSNVWTNDSTRGWTADQDKVNVSLVQGWNKLLVKISQYGGIWCFSVKLCDSSGNALPGITYALNPPATSAPTGDYIKSWLLNGYYSNTNNSTRLSTDYLGGEGNVAPGEGSASGGKTWTKVDSSVGRIDLAAYYNNPSYCAGYAHVYINSATAQTGQLWLGSDNGIKVWLNGSNVWTNDSTRGWTADQDKVNVSLVQGWNKLLVKISQYGGIWCFSAKLCDSSGNALEGITYALNPPATSAPTGDYIKSWLLNGYYSNTNNSTRLSTDYLGGEGNVAPGEGSASGGKTWTKVDSSVGRIDLAAYYNNPSYCAGYAHVYINSATAQTGQLWLGSDNGIKVWLNGSNVWTNDSTRGWTADQDKVNVSLVQGWNKLLVKISQYGGIWCFSAKLCDSSGNALPGITYALNGPDTTPPDITNVNATPGSTSAVIEWDTDEPATTMVDYGTTTALGAGYDNADMVTHHKVELTGLTSGTTYYFKVGSADAADNVTWSDEYWLKTATVPIATGPYITTWLLNGYYQAARSHRLATDFLGGEAGVSPTEGDVNGGKAWFTWASSANVVNLGEAFGYPTDCSGYAFAYVYSPSARQANLWMGSDDGVKVWLNGQLVWANDVLRSCADGQDRVAVNLNAGWNRLLVKVSQAAGGWKFVVRVCDSSGNAIPGVGSSTAP